MNDKNCKDILLLGKNEDGSYALSKGYQHILAIAPTGAGKGVGLVIPNLLSSNESVIVHDIKFENYTLTNSYRKSQGQEIFLWNPLGGEKSKTHRYNILDSLSSDPQQIITDIQKIADLFIKEKDLWNMEAKNLFLLLVLHLSVKEGRVRSFGEMIRVLMSGVQREFATGYDNIHPLGESLIIAFLKKEPKKQAKIISTLSSYLHLWLNPAVDYATSASDFNIEDFKKKKMTLYVGLNSSDILILQPLMNLFYQHIMGLLMQQTSTKYEELQGIVFFLDEFPTLGKMQMFETSIPYLRGSKVRMFLMSQDIQQIEGVYGKFGMNSITSNSTFKILFAAHDYETADFMSRISINKNSKKCIFSPEEIMSLPSNEQIIFENNQDPVVVKKIIYYNEKEFQNKL